MIKKFFLVAFLFCFFNECSTLKFINTLGKEEFTTKDELEKKGLIPKGSMYFVLAGHGIRIVKTYHYDKEGGLAGYIECERPLKNIYKDVQPRYMKPKLEAKNEEHKKAHKLKLNKGFDHIKPRYMQIPERYKAKSHT